MIIEIKKDNSCYRYNELVQSFLCEHREVTIEAPCCEYSPTSTIECGCGGFTQVTCHNTDCTGLEDDFIEKLMFTDCN